MKFFGKLFGESVAEIRPIVEQDAQCETCKGYLQHSQERLTFAGKSFCRQGCVPPSLIKQEEDRIRSEKLQAERAKQAASAQAEQARLQSMRESEGWIQDNLALLERHGLDPQKRLRELHRALHPYSRRYLPQGATMFTVREGLTVYTIPPTE